MNHNFKLNEEDSFIKTNRKKNSPGIIGLVIKWGIVKTERQANVVLTLFVIAGIAAIVWLNIQTFGN